MEQKQGFVKNIVSFLLLTRYFVGIIFYATFQTFWEFTYIRECNDRFSLESGLHCITLNLCMVISMSPRFLHSTKMARLWKGCLFGRETLTNASKALRSATSVFSFSTAPITNCQKPHVEPGKLTLTPRPCQLTNSRLFKFVFRSLGEKNPGQKKLHPITCLA